MTNARAIVRPRPRAGTGSLSRSMTHPVVDTRRAFTRLVPLVHTVKRPQPTVRLLMRTVLRDTKPSFLDGLVRSPVLLSRASGRSLGLNKVVAKRLSSVISSPQVSARAMACARRQIRREVILATGRGGGRHRPPSYRSNWRC